METLLRELYNISLELESNSRSFYEKERRETVERYDSLLDKVDKALGAAFHETLYDAVLEYISVEQSQAFYLGLRLGLQLHAL